MKTTINLSKLKKFENQQITKLQKVKGGSNQSVIIEDHVVFLESSIVNDDLILF